MKTLEMFGKEKSVVTRERMRNQYSALEYLLSKVLAEFPLDAAFAAVFAAVLKSQTGLCCSVKVLCGTFSLMTIAGASLGFAVGSLTSSAEEARVVGFPIMVLFMIVGVINPSGVDHETAQDHPEPTFIKWMKLASPIRWAIEALCVAEYRDMEFAPTSKRRGALWGFIKFMENPRMGAYALVKNGNQVLEAIGLADATFMSHIKSLGILTGANLAVSLIGLTFFGPKFKKAVSEESHIFNNIVAEDDDEPILLTNDDDEDDEHENVPPSEQEEINEMSKNRRLLQQEKQKQEKNKNNNPLVSVPSYSRGLTIW
jgi:hypothetical protein